MQETQSRKVLKIEDLTLDEKSRLVDFFAWLINQDKKQNPALYQLKIDKND